MSQTPLAWASPVATVAPVEETATGLRRKRLADTRPELMNTPWLSTSRFPGLDTISSRAVVMGTLAERYNVVPRSTDEYFEMVKASADEARLLHVEEGETPVRVTGTTYEANDAPVGQRYSLRANGVLSILLSGVGLLNTSPEEELRQVSICLETADNPARFKYV